LIKILHTADVHLDSPLVSLALRDEGLRDKVMSASRAAFTSLVDFALSEEVSALLICGDLYDGAKRSAKTAAFLTTQFDRMRVAGIPVFYIKGNHDAENPLTGEVSLPSNVHIFDGRGGKIQLDSQDIWIHGVSFSAKQAPDSLLNKFSTPVLDAVNIAMLHTSLAGAAGHDPYAPCTVSELSSLGFDYWALGHIHKRQVHSEDPWVVMPGIPQGRDIGEYGSKSATIIKIDQAKLSIDEVLTSQVEFLNLDIDISTATTEDDIRSLIRSECKVLARELSSENAIVRVGLSGQTSLRWQLLRDSELWQEAIHNIAEETGRLWIEKIKLTLSELTDSVASSGATDELGSLMIDIQTDASFKATTRSMIEEVLAQLPPDQRAHLLSDENATEELIKSISIDGSDYVLALMKGASQ